MKKIINLLLIAFTVFTGWAQQGGGNVMDQIYDKISETFGVQNQLFTMEFPGRVLNESLYSYDINSSYSELEKPMSVIQSEFRLSNSLYDTYQLTGGPNGKTLSTVYSEALNMLVPKYDKNDREQDVEKQRIWLLEPVKTFIDGNATTASRIDIYALLNQRYLEAKEAWETEKTAKYFKAQNSQEVTDEEYARWLAITGPAREAEIQAKYTDLVVRGYYHEVRNLLGYMDISSLGEELEEAKNRMRDTAMLSFDESQNIYPVYFQPNNWFQSLNTNFTPIDLLMSPEAVQAQLALKEQQLTTYQDQYARLLASQGVDPSSYNEQIAAAQQNLATAQTNMLEQFTNVMITAAEFAIKAALAASTGGASEAASEAINIASKAAVMEEANKKLKSFSSVAKLFTPETWSQMSKLQVAIYDAQNQITNTSRALTSLLSQQAIAGAKETKDTLLTLRQKITEIQSEISNIKQVWLEGAVKGETNETNSSLIPNVSHDMAYSQIIIETSKVDNNSESSLSTSVKHKSWTTGFLFWSHHHEETSVSAHSDKTMNSMEKDIEIGFLATKVTFDRSGWFNPQFFSLTRNMYNITDPQVKISQGPPQSLSSQDLNTYNQENPGFFPAFPVSFIIAKDITFKFSYTQSNMESWKNFFKKTNGSSTSILLFSLAGGGGTGSQNQSYYYSFEGDKVVLKIPGPQIIGWFLEFLPKDDSSEYTSMPDGYLPDMKSQSGL